MLNEPVPVSEAGSSSSSPAALLRDLVRESWQDLEIEYQLRKQDLERGVRETRGSIHKAYKGTGRAVKHTVRAVKEDLGDQLQELKADFRVQRRLLKQDLHDFVQASREWSLKVAARRREQEEEYDGLATSHTTPTAPETPSTQQSGSSENPETKNQSLLQEIRAYQAKFTNPAFITELNQLIDSKLTSCQDLVDYYEQRPELKEYTLTKELHRMQYTLYTDQGQKLTTAQEIAEYALGHPDSNDILWRAANQSIFGDVISTLTCEEGLVRPQFSTGSFVDDISLVLDLGRDRPHITAECFVNVTIPGSEGERLQLAGVLVGVYFCPVLSKMEARVLHVSPSRPLMQEELEGAVENLMNRG